MEASLGAFVKDLEYIKSSKKVTSTELSTKASTKAFMEVTSTQSCANASMEVMEDFAEVIEAFIRVTCTEVLWKFPWKLP